MNYIAIFMSVCMLSLGVHYHKDIAFGKDCYYVEGNVMVGRLYDENGVAYDSTDVYTCWDQVVNDDYITLNQVYTSDGVLLLPIDFGSDKYHVRGLNVKKSDCIPCQED